MPRSLFLVLGNQLFPRSLLGDARDAVVFMAEDEELCTYVKHHKQKIVLFLAAMRSYRDDLAVNGFDVHYHEFTPGSKERYEDRLLAACRKHKCRDLVHFEIEDRFMAERIDAFARKHKLEHRVLESPMFLCPADRFTDYVQGVRRPFMADFYKRERRRLGLLMDGDEPTGGKWSFDADNRKKLPAKVTPPEVRHAKPTEHVAAVSELVVAEFPDHPGSTADMWLPTTRRQALAWLREFIDERLELFGDYEDAMTTRSPTLYHSVLTPSLNLGLITPKEVVDRVIEAAEERDIPLNSLEGFVRQVIGWREFIRGVYRHYGEQQEAANFFEHGRRLSRHWWDGTTGIVPLDDTIRTAQRYGWTHHIPRLMVAGNLMTLCEIHPHDAHRWFMEMYVDSSDWVMGPNVYGMALFSDGGIFATKPYICGSNYLRKMSDYPKGDWCDVVDGLYWRFVDKHLKFFRGNPRLSMMTRALDRLADDRRARIFDAAETFLDEFTLPEKA